MPGFPTKPKKASPAASAPPPPKATPPKAAPPSSTPRKGPVLNLVPKLPAVAQAPQKQPPMTPAQVKQAFSAQPPRKAAKPTLMQQILQPPQKPGMPSKAPSVFQQILQSVQKPAQAAAAQTSPGRLEPSVVDSAPLVTRQSMLMQPQSSPPPASAPSSAPSGGSSYADEPITASEAEISGTKSALEKKPGFVEQVKAFVGPITWQKMAIGAVLLYLAYRFLSKRKAA